MKAKKISKSINLVFLTLFIIINSSFSVNSQSKTTKDASEIESTDPTVRYSVLPNGIRYYLYNTNNPKDNISTHFIVKAGKRQQNTDQTEAAHILEHILLTRYIVKDSCLSKVAWNGLTEDTYTEYMFTFNDFKTLSPLLNRTASVLYGDITITPLDAQSEKKIVIEENRLKYTPADSRSRIYNRLLELPPHPESNFTPAITNETTKDAIVRFYRNWYHTDISAIIIVGSIDIQKTEHLIKERFKNYKPKKQNNLDTTSKNTSSQREKSNHFKTSKKKIDYIVETVPDTEESNLEIRVLFKQTSPGNKNPGYDKFNYLIENAASTILTKRLNDVKDENDNEAISHISAGFYQNYHESNGLEWFARLTDVTKIKQSLLFLLMEIERLKKFGINDSEFVEILNLLKQKNISAQTTEETANILREHFLSNIEVVSISEKEKKYKNSINLLTKRKVNEYILKLINDHNFKIGLLIPKKNQSLIPSETEIWRLYKSIDNNSLLPFIKRPLDPIIINIDTAIIDNKINATFTQKTDKNLKVSEITLSNNNKLLIKSTDSTKEERISFRSIKPISKYSYTGNAFLSALVTPYIITNSGLQNLSKRDIQQYIETNDISIYAFLDNQGAGIAGSCPRNKLLQFLKLVYLFHLPVKSDTSRYIAAKTALAQHTGDAEHSSLCETLSDIMGYPIVLESQLSDKEFEKVDISKCITIYNECFTDIQNYTFAFSGIDASDENVVLLTKYFNSLKPFTQKNKIQKSNSIEGINESIDTVVVNNKIKIDRADVYIFYANTLPTDEKERASLPIAADLIEKSLRQRIRMTEAGTYSLNVSFNIIRTGTSNKDQIYQLIVKFSCDPQKAKQLANAALDEMKHFIENGVKQSDFNESVEKFRKDRSITNISNNKWSVYLTNIYIDGYDSSHILLRSSITDQITPQDIVNAARKMLQAKHILYVEEPSNIANKKL